MFIFKTELWVLHCALRRSWATTHVVVLQRTNQMGDTNNNFRISGGFLPFNWFGAVKHSWQLVKSRLLCIIEFNESWICSNTMQTVSSQSQTWRYYRIVSRRLLLHSFLFRSVENTVENKAVKTPWILLYGICIFNSFFLICSRVNFGPLWTHKPTSRVGFLGNRCK